MNNKEQVLQQGIKELVLKMPIDEITVTTLCDYCHVNRQTFYYHFRDISDLLSSIFLTRSRSLMNLKISWDDMVVLLLDYVFKNFNYLVVISKSSAQDILKDFFYDIVYVRVSQEIDNNPMYKEMHKEDKQFVARIFSEAASSELIFYISQNIKLSYEEILRRFHIIHDGAFQTAVKNAINSRG